MFGRSGVDGFFTREVKVARKREKRLRLGGPRLYRKARRFFIGVVLGSFAAGGVWAVVDTLTGSTGNMVLYR